MTLQDRHDIPKLKNSLAAEIKALIKKTGKQKLPATAILSGGSIVYGDGGTGYRLTVKEVDAAPTVGDVTTIIVSNGTLTDNGDGSVTIVIGGGGDNVSVNGVVCTDADLDNATPAAPASSLNVSWQKDALAPNNVSAYIGYGAGLSVAAGVLVCSITQYTDELAQDTVCGIFTASTSIKWTYNDAANTMSGRAIAIVDADGDTLVQIEQGADDDTFRIDTAGVERFTINGVGYLTQNIGVVINETGADSDSRIEGDTDVNLIYTDAGNDRVGIGVSNPVSKVTIDGSLTFVERVAGVSPGAGYGELFVVSSTPSTLRFIDDAGGSFQLGGGGLIRAVSTKTASYTLTGEDCTVFLNQGAPGVYVLTFPAAGSHVGRHYWISNLGLQTWTLTTVANQATIAYRETFHIVSDGAAWNVVA